MLHQQQSLISYQFQSPTQWSIPRQWARHFPQTQSEILLYQSNWELLNQYQCRLQRPIRLNWKNNITVIYYVWGGGKKRGMTKKVSYCCCCCCCSSHHVFLTYPNSPNMTHASAFGTKLARGGPKRIPAIISPTNPGIFKRRDATWPAR